MMISGTACHVQHDTHLATGMLRLTLIQRGVFFMAHIQYSITDLYSQEPLERLLYISSATYGNDWISMFHSHSFAELFYVLDGQGHFCTESEEVPIERDSPVSYTHLLSMGLLKIARLAVTQLYFASFTGSPPSWNTSGKK